MNSCAASDVCCSFGSSAIRFIICRNDPGDSSGTIRAISAAVNELPCAKIAAYTRRSPLRELGSRLTSNQLHWVALSTSRMISDNCPTGRSEKTARRSGSTVGSPAYADNGSRWTALSAGALPTAQRVLDWGGPTDVMNRSAEFNLRSKPLQRNTSSDDRTDQTKAAISLCRLPYARHLSARRQSVGALSCAAR